MSSIGRALAGVALCCALAAAGCGRSNDSGNSEPGAAEVTTAGTTTLLVPCDDEAHEIAITPKSDAGPGETETKSISGD
jgi:hypothetical protein